MSSSQPNSNSVSELSRYWINSAIPQPTKKIELYTLDYYLTCTLGGVIGMFIYSFLIF